MTDEPAAALSWRVPSRAEITARRSILQRAVLTAVAFTGAMLFALPSRWWGGGLFVGAVAGLLMALWQMQRFQRRYGNQPANMHLNSMGFRWGSDEQSGGEIKRDQVVGFRIEPANASAAATLVLILQNDFESQPIFLLEPATETAVQHWLQSHWSLEETPSPRTSPVGTRSLRLPVYIECHPENLEWHWEGNSAGLRTLTAALRTAAAELPLPPAGASPKLLEVIGTRRDGSEMLVAVDHQPWLDELTLAAPAEQLSQLADAIDENLNNAAAADFEVGFTLPGKHSGRIYCHVQPE